jgi:hypothetical protein
MGNTPIRKVYYLTKKWKWLDVIFDTLLSIAVAIPIVLLFSLILEVGKPSDVIGPVFFCGLLYLLGKFLLLGSERVILLPDGIIYVKHDRTVFSKWAELTNIEKRYYYFFRIESLCAREPSLHEINRKPSSSIKRQKEQPVFIPISIFADNWCESELGQQIKQYAPQLFEPAQPKETP